MNDRPRSVSGIVFLTVFLDIAGFSIIFPLFPAMLDHYLALEGEDSAVGGLVAWLQHLTGEDRHAVVTLFGGVLGSFYSVMQFVAAPVWGGLSDRIGRRPALLWSIAGLALSYLLWVFAGSFAVLVAARLLGGAMAGSISVAAAAVADTTSGPNRARGMGMVGMAIGLGFILGPVLGGVSYTESISLLAAWPEGAGWGINPFSTCALVSFLLAAINLLWVARRFPETLPERGVPSSVSFNPFARLRRLAFPGVVRTNVIYFIHLTAFAAMEFSLTFLAVERFAFTVGDNTVMLAYAGLVIALVQGGVVRRIVPKYGERRVAIFGLGLMVPGFVIVGLAPAAWLMYAGLTALAVGSALTMPTLSALVSRYVPADRQGLAQGTIRSMGSLSRAVGPVLGGVLYWQLGSAAPYLAGAAVLLIPIAMATGLPPVPSAPRAPAK